MQNTFIYVQSLSRNHLTLSCNRHRPQSDWSWWYSLQSIPCWVLIVVSTCRNGSYIQRLEDSRTALSRSFLNVSLPLVLIINTRNISNNHLYTFRVFLILVRQFVNRRKSNTNSHTTHPILTKNFRNNTFCYYEIIDALVFQKSFWAQLSYINVFLTN